MELQCPEIVHPLPVWSLIIIEGTPIANYPLSFSLVSWNLQPLECTYSGFLLCQIRDFIYPNSSLTPFLFMLCPFPSQQRAYQQLATTSWICKPVPFPGLYTPARTWIISKYLKHAQVLYHNRLSHLRFCFLQGSNVLVQSYMLYHYFKIRWSLVIPIFRKRTLRFCISSHRYHFGQRSMVLCVVCSANIG